jgi:hypothetical protein
MAIVKKKTGFGSSTSSQSKPEASLDNMIRERAYYIWESKGRPAGQDMNIWLQAKKEITSKMK